MILRNLQLFSSRQSTSLITGFYASQLLCLYRRNQRWAVDGTRCYYSKYLVHTTHSFHRNVKYLLTPAGQQSFLPQLPKLPKLSCPFIKSKRATAGKPRRTLDDEFNDFQHFVDPGYKQHERFFENRGGFAGTNVYNVNNDGTTETVQQESTPAKEEAKEPTTEENETAGIDEAIRQLAHIVGELEFEMGVECAMAGNFNDAVDHFRLSTTHKHPGGIFNLALCYEHGVGVKRDMKAARRLYEIASKLGHAKAAYNLGVFHAQGLGGAHKNFQRAKQYFEQAAELGNSDAIQALRLLLPPPKKLPVIAEVPDDDFFFNEKSIVSAIASNGLMRRIAAS